ncbi:MAG: DUF3159 domain-containing protein [Cellulomonadaceae bacterium]|jgi:hypothetical protein|nr:DUF3159 domain-containing protein [Cellulomonadaceae bacterium]
MSTPAPQRGVHAVTGDEFSFLSAVGGIRGLVEAMAPGTVFIVVFIATGSGNLGASMGSSVAVAAAAVILRIIQGTPVVQALSGLIGIAIGVWWAWQSGQAQNFFAWGLIVNVLYLIGVLISIVIRWPAVGVVVEAVRAGWTAERAESGGAAAGGGEATSADGLTTGANEEPASLNPFKGMSRWRVDPATVHRYTMASWIWVAMFAIRLAVQLPLYFSTADNAVGLLGIFRLIQGVPLWGLVLYLTWLVVRGIEPVQAEVKDALAGLPEPTEG